MSVSTDELIIEVPQNKVVETSKKILSILHQSEDLKLIKEFVQLSVFRLRTLSIPLEYFVKDIYYSNCNQPFQEFDLVMPIEYVFKGVNPEHYSILYKKFFGMNLNEADLRISWNTADNSYDCVDVDSLHLEDVRAVLSSDTTAATVTS